MKTQQLKKYGLIRFSLFTCLIVASFMSITSESSAQVDSVYVYVEVFEDVNEDGIRQPEEPGMPDIRISNGHTLSTTDIDGSNEVWVDRDFFRFVTLTIPSGSWPTTSWYKHFSGNAEVDTVHFGLKPNPESAQDPVRWIHMCDTQVQGWQDGWDMSADLEAMNELPDPPQLIFNAGDIVNVGSDRIHWVRYMDQLATADFPVFHAVGNHDTTDTDIPLEHYEEFVGPPYYSLELGSWHFIAYNAEYVGTPMQDTWLDNDIAAAPEGMNFAVIQHRMVVEMPENLAQHWEELGIRSVHSGHWHSFQFAESDEHIRDYNIGRMRSGPLDRSARQFGVVTCETDGSIDYDLRRFGADHRAHISHPTDGSVVSGETLDVLVQAYDTSQNVINASAVIADESGNVLSGNLTSEGISLWRKEFPLETLDDGLCELTVSGSFTDGQGFSSHSHFTKNSLMTVQPECNSDWPMFRRSANGSSFQSQAVTPPLQLLWAIPTTGQIILSSPVVADGTVYFGYRSQNKIADSGVLACDALTGNPRWFTHLPGGVSLAPAVAENVVIATTIAGSVHGLDTATGNELWAISQTEDNVFDMTAPVFQGDYAWVGGEPRPRQINWRTGESSWTTDVMSTNWFPYTYSAPAVSDDYLYFSFFGLPGGQWGYNTGAFTVVDRNTGNILYQDEWGAYRSPICKGDTVYVVGAVDRHHQMLTARDPLGSVLWTAEQELGRGTSSPALGNGVLVSPGANGTIEAFDSDTGSHLWSHEVGVPLFDVIAGVLNWGKATFATPAIADSVVYIGSADGFLYGLDLFSGEELWKWNFGTTISSSVALSGNMLFVGASDGHLYAFCETSEMAPSSIPDGNSGSRIQFYPPTPNPGHMPTKFAWSMPGSEHVVVKIYDLRGTLVRTVIDEHLEGGRHEAVWDGQNRSGQPVAAGVYFASISVGSKSTVQKVVRMRNH